MPGVGGWAVGQNGYLSSRRCPEQSLASFCRARIGYRCIACAASDARPCLRWPCGWRLVERAAARPLLCKHKQRPNHGNYAAARGGLLILFAFVFVVRGRGGGRGRAPTRKPRKLRGGWGAQPEHQAAAPGWRGGNRRRQAHQQAHQQARAAGTPVHCRKRQLAHIHQHPRYARRRGTGGDWPERCGWCVGGGGVEEAGSGGA